MPFIYVLINGRAVEIVDSFDCRGVIIDRKLKFELHINSSASKVNLISKKLYHFNICLSRFVKIQLVHGLNMPVFFVWVSSIFRYSWLCSEEASFGIY